MVDWQSTATFNTLQARASLLQVIRQFFAERGVMEVETPSLSLGTVTDVHLASFPVPGLTDSGEPGYLQTSPEYAMKRLLASGSGPIYQICKAFRREETSRQHNPEFTMLEWYRPGFSLPELMDEVGSLLQQVLDRSEIPRFTYQQLFQQHLQIDPHSIETQQLREVLLGKINMDISGLDDTDCLQLLMNHYIEPALPSACFVYDYPVAQAALARIEHDGQGVAVAQRFELYCGGMELANGYHELSDAEEQRPRFAKDQARRKELGLPSIAADQRLLAALEHGLPDCSGVALGVDRLLMVKLGVNSIEEVLSFPGDRA